MFAQKLGRTFKSVVRGEKLCLHMSNVHAERTGGAVTNRFSNPALLSQTAAHSLLGLPPESLKLVPGFGVPR